MLIEEAGDEREREQIRRDAYQRTGSVSLRDEDNEGAFTSDGWFCTGDTVHRLQHLWSHYRAGVLAYGANALAEESSADTITGLLRPGTSMKSLPVNVSLPLLPST